MVVLVVASIGSQADHCRPAPISRRADECLLPLATPLSNSQDRVCFRPVFHYL